VCALCIHAACVRGAAFFLRVVRGGEGEVQYIRGITMLNTYIWRGRGVAVCWEVHEAVHI